MKRIVKAFLWIACYGGVCWWGIKAKLGFDILTGQHWKILFDKSPQRVWPYEFAPKTVLCKVLLLFIVVGILGLSVITKNKKRRIPVVKGELPQASGFRPSPMASQGRMAAPAPMASAPVTSPVTPVVENPSVGFAPPAPPILNSMGEAIKRITEVANIFEVSVFPHVKLENTFTHLVISDDSTALLLKIFPQSGTWKVEQAPDPSDSVWTINEQQQNIKDILLSTQTLSRLEPEANAISVIVLTNATLENPSEVKEYLNQQGIRIVTLLPDGQTIPDIPTWQDLLSEFFPLKEQEQNHETDSNL